MSKTALTKEIEKALHYWHPTNYGGFRVDSFRDGIEAIEVPVACGSVKAGIVDFVRVQECFVQEEKYGICKLKEKDAICNEPRPDFCTTFGETSKTCSERVCKHYKTIHNYTIDTLIICVEIKVSVSDFHSNHGHNHVGHCNYYAIPAAMYQKVKDLIPENIGILIFYEGNEKGEGYCGIRKKRECVAQELAEEKQKWLIMSVAKRAAKIS